MTTVDERTRREELRHEIAALLELDVAALADPVDPADAGLDSLGMMRLLTWLETRGVQLDGPATVGEVLTLLENAASGRVRIRRTGAAMPGRTATEVDLPAGPSDPLAPVLRTRAFHLTAVRPDDLGFLYGLSASEQTSFRWRFRGAPPSLERFAESLWTQVLVQYVVRRNRDERPVGHVLAYGADAGLHHAYLGAVFVPEVAGTGLAAQAVATFVRSLFHVFPMRKLYLQVPGYNWAQVASGRDGMFRVEGVLREHVYFAGRRWDEYTCAIYADQFTHP